MLRGLQARSLVPAIVLAALVLAVFSQLQNYGPQSAVRRFHEALLTNNDKELEEVLYQPTDPLAVARIVSRFYPLIHEEGAHIRLRDVQRSPSVVYVSVSYHTPNHAGYAVWVTTKTPSGWKVDAAGTWSLWHSASS